MKRPLMPCILLLLMPVSCFAQKVPTPLPTASVAPPGANTAGTAVPIDKGTIILKNMKRRLDRHMQTVNGWSTQASHQIALSVIVGIFGLVIGLLQRASKAWAKGSTIGIGLAVSVITLFTNKVYLADYRALQRSVAQAMPIIDDLQDAIDRFDPSQSWANLQTIEADFKTKCGKIDLIGQTLLGESAPPVDSSRTTGPVFGIPVIHAQSQKGPPAWVTTGKPADNAFTYFVGTTENGSLIAAQSASFEIALDKAAHWLRGDQHGQNQSEPTKQLLELVRRSVETADTWYTYDRASRVYSYSTLLRLTNELQTLEVKPEVRAFDPEQKLGSGIGPFRFGMTPQQVNDLLPHRFGSVASLPVAREFRTAEVRYYWVYTAEFPPPASPGSAFEPLGPFQSCWGEPNSYVTFLFTQGKLTRISVRFFWDCANRTEAAKAFADSYFIPAAGSTGSVGFRRALSRATVDIRLAQDMTAIDVFVNGSPQPGG